MVRPVNPNVPLVTGCSFAMIVSLLIVPIRSGTVLTHANDYGLRRYQLSITPGAMMTWVLFSASKD
jgi:hypothetical protein